MQYYVPSTKRRILAGGIDQIIIMIPAILIFYPNLKALFNTSEIKINIFVLAAVITCQFLYFFLSYLLMEATLGQKLVGQKLVSISGEKLAAVQIAIRVLCDQLSVFFSYGLFCLIFFRFDRTHLSDWLAETKVVQDEERKLPAVRRVVVCVLLTGYFCIDGFHNFYNLVHLTEIRGSQLILKIPLKNRSAVSLPT